MKKLLVILLVIIVVVVGCADRQPCLIKIIDTYQKDIQANDGVVKRAWKTVIELPNKSRGIADGKYGEKGDLFWGIVKPFGLSSGCYIEVVEIEEEANHAFMVRIIEQRASPDSCGQWIKLTPMSDYMDIPKIREYRFKFNHGVGLGMYEWIDSIYVSQIAKSYPQ